MPTLIPVADKIIIKRDDAESVTAGGIVLPDAAKEKPKQGTVVAVGEEATCGEDGALVCKPGDKVIFSAYAGVDISVDDEEYLIVQVVDLLCVVKA